MRSRYSAYAVGEYSYILSTYAPTTRPALTAEQLADDNVDTQWLSLRVLNSTVDEEKGTVSFIAYYRQGGEIFQLSEHSRFVKTSQWLYVDGDIADDSGRVKLGRNDVCICGSGKKFKRCCGR